MDEQNLAVQTRISALDLQRQKFINESKLTKRRENETLARLRDFRTKVRSADEENWMNNKLKFHIDSQRAYDVGKTQDLQTGFQSFTDKYAHAYSEVKRPDLGGDVV